MQLLPIILTTALAVSEGPTPAADKPPSPEQVRQTVERKL